MDAAAETKANADVNEEPGAKTEVGPTADAVPEEASAGKAGEGSDDGAMKRGGGDGDAKCYNCGEAGHKRRACPKPRNEANVEERVRKDRRDREDRPAREGPAPELEGSTVVEGGKRRKCDKCRKVFGVFDLNSFKKHTCGRAGRSERKRDIGGGGGGGDDDDGDDNGGGSDNGKPRRRGGGSDDGSEDGGDGEGARKGDGREEKRARGERAERFAPLELVGSTLLEDPECPGSGKKRKCDKCAKVFSQNDVESFKNHVCGRPKGSGKSLRDKEREGLPRSGRSGNDYCRSENSRFFDPPRRFGYYDDRDRRGGYDDRRGGYDDRRGGYDDRRGGYDDRRGGFDDRHGWYDDRRVLHDDRRFGYDDRERRRYRDDDDDDYDRKRSRRSASASRSRSPAGRGTGKAPGSGKDKAAAGAAAASGGSKDFSPGKAKEQQRSRSRSLASLLG